MNQKESSRFDKLKESEQLIRKKLIMKAATDLLSLKQFHEISIRDIAKEADIYLALIYKHFQNRTSLNRFIRNKKTCLFFAFFIREKA